MARTHFGPKLTAGIAPPVWRTDADRSWVYGSLSDWAIAPEPRRADGEVRWFLDDLGWGLIAHHEGDLFVLFSAIDGTGFRSLREGQRVIF